VPPSFSKGTPLRWLLAGSTASAFGDGIRAAALPMLAAATLGSPFKIAAVSATSSLPWLLLGLPVGAYADRWDRRHMMIGADLLRAAALAGMAGLVIVGAASLWTLLALAFTLGTGRVMFDCASSALLPSLVGPTNLVTANGRLMSGQIIGRDLLGQAAGGTLYAIGRIIPLLTDAVTFLLSALAVVHLPPNRPATAQQAGMLASIREGLRYIRGDRTVMLLSAASLALNIIYAGQAAIFVVLARNTMHLTPDDYGLVLAAGGIGGIAAGLLASRLTQSSQRVPLLASVMLLSTSQLGIAASQGPYSLAAAYLVCGAALTLWNTASTAVRQSIVPAALLGRVTGATRLLAWGAAPAGALAAGALATALGPRATLALAGTASLAAFTALAALLHKTPAASPTHPETATKTHTHTE
jgi:MFS family permease